MKALLQHAAENVPYYQKQWRRQGVTVRHIRRLKDLSLLPLTSRADLEADPNAFLAKGVDKKNCVTRCGSGSPGGKTPRVFLSPEECDLINAVERRILYINGLRGRYSSLIAVPPDQVEEKQSVLDALLHGKRGVVSVSETPTEQLHVLKRMRPECFGAPLWILNRLAKKILAGENLGFHPRLVLSWGEPLREIDRETLREAFGVPPTDIYRTWEFGPIAAECPSHGGLHLNFDLVYIEILRDGKPVEPGEAGEIVVTTLANRTMPLIRYRLGDTAIWKEGGCACGWKGPALQGVHGRSDEVIVLPGGAVVTSRQFEECLDQFTNVEAYRAIQTDPRMVEVLVVPGTLFQERTAQLVRKKCIELFNNQVGVELRVVKELPLLSSRRRQSVICKLPRV